MKVENLLGLATVPFLLALSNSAFSIGTRKQMIKRDNGACVDCGKRFDDGWLLDCSHVDHDHSSELYDDVNNGRVQCLDDHLKYHLSIGDINSANLIKKRIRETRGGHTRAWLDQHPEK